MIVTIPSTAMRKKPNMFSELETECLFGEKVEVLDNHTDWLYCKLLTDNYCGWVKESDLGYTESSTHRVISKRTFLFKNVDIKSYCINYLPLGAQLNVKKIDNNWAEVILPGTIKVAYTPTQHIVKLNSKINDWISVAEKLIGTPYKWGGRDSLGIDCSALLQISYQVYGENIHRNTVDQVKLRKKVVEKISDLSRGCVIFWKGHVGIMVDNLNCIHASAFHMETVIEPLDKIIFRNKEKLPILKMMNFN